MAKCSHKEAVDTAKIDWGGHSSLIQILKITNYRLVVFKAKEVT